MTQEKQNEVMAALERELISPTASITWMRYVPIHRRAEFEAAGWTVTDKLKETHHGQFAYLGIWRGEGEPT